MTAEERQAALEEKRRTWADHIENWKASGQSQVEYCQRHDLQYHRFTYWRQKHLRQARSSSSIVEISLPVPQDDSSSPAMCPIRILTPSGLRIEVDRDFDPVALRQIIHTVGRP